MPFQLPELPYAKDALAPRHVGRDARISPRQASQGLRHQDQRADRRRSAAQRRLAHRGRAAGQECRGTTSCSTTARSCGTTASSGNALRHRRASSQAASLPQLIQDGFGKPKTPCSRSCRRKRSIISPTAGHGWCSTAVSLRSHRSTMPTRRSSTRAWCRCSRSMCGSMLITSIIATSARVSLERTVEHRQLGLRRAEPRRQGFERANQEGSKRVRPSLLLEPVAGPEHPGDHRHADGDDRHGDGDARPDRHVGD